MTDDIHMVVYTVALTWLMIMTAAMLKTGGDLGKAMSNRDATLAESPLAARADRAAKNMVENIGMFLGAWAAARFAGAVGGKLVLGAQIFFAARLVYWPIYLAGIKGVRTLVWAVSVVGIAMLAVAALTA